MNNTTNETRRIWLDTTVLPFVSLETLEALAQNNVLVIANTAIDVKLFQENFEWVDEKLKKGQLVIEMWNTLDEMVKKAFFWSSCNIETPACDSFEEAASYLPNTQQVLNLAELVKVYGIPKGQWPIGCEYEPPAPLTEAEANYLGIPVDSTRTAILAAAREQNKMRTYDEYNARYCKIIAKQHTSKYILCSDGVVVELED